MSVEEREYEKIVKIDYDPDDPGVSVIIFYCIHNLGSISAGNPMTLSSSSIPENLLEPSQPSEKFGLPLRQVCATESEQTDWIPETSVWSICR